MDNKATLKNKVRDKNGYSVHLIYEYRGYEYMIFAGNNGYSESLREQHKYEQHRIDTIIAEKEKQAATEYDPEKDAWLAFEWAYKFLS